MNREVHFVVTHLFDSRKSVYFWNLILHFVVLDVVVDALWAERGETAREATKVSDDFLLVLRAGKDLFVHYKCSVRQDLI